MSYQAAPVPVETDIPYVAGDFTANGAMTWTVDAADIKNWAFTLQGRIMRLWFRSITTTVGGVASNFLFIKLPLGKTVAREFITVITAAPGGAASEACLAFAAVGATQITLLRFGANWVIGVNNTDLGFSDLAFEVN